MIHIIVKTVCWVAFAFIFGFSKLSSLATFSTEKLNNNTNINKCAVQRTKFHCCTDNSEKKKTAGFESRGNHAMAKEMLSSCQWGLSHWDFTESIIGTQQSITHTKHRKLNMRPSRAANLNIAATKLLHQLDRAYHRLLKFRSSTFRLTLFLNPRDLNMPSRGLSHKNLHAASTTVYRLDLQHQKWLVLKSRNQFDPMLILQPTHWLTVCETNQTVIAK